MLHTAGSVSYTHLDGDLRQYTKEMNAALNGRGGGKPFFVQGSAQATEDEIRNLSLIHIYCSNSGALFTAY